MCEKNKNDINMEWREEKEFTYEICAENVQKLFEILINNNVIIIDNYQYILEKGKNQTMLYFLVSDNYKATRTNNGIRYRVKVDLEKECIRYTEKEFIDGLRYEKNVDMGKDIEKVFSIMNDMPPIDALMIKYLYKYEYINYLINSRFQIVIDCCYALSPQDYNICSEPFYYIEFEEKSGCLLEKWVQTDIFKKISKMFLNDMSYISHNRIRKCKDVFNNKNYECKSVSQLRKDIKKIRKNYLENQAKYNTLAKINNTFIRGEKGVERSNGIESELKLVGQKSPNEILSLVRKIINSKYYLVKSEPRIINDIYFDNENNDLLNNDASFRIRQRKKKEGWISGFKCLKSNIKTEMVLDRDKTRTALSINEILKYKNGMIIGNASENLYQFLTKLNIDKTIKPKVLVIEYRDRYVVRSKYSCKVDNGNIDTIKDNHFAMKRSEILHIIFDYVTAYDLSNMTNDEIDFIIKYGEVDVTKRNIRSHTFTATEIEPNKRHDVYDIAEDLFQKVCSEIINKDINLLKKSKYKLSMEKFINED